ncbi:hypothetical protein [Powai lake megavirus]|uniref:Uncharacterized protein n=1 Tax=Powai lake megavirus TaxID=1842663 RepID=A0A160ERA1_9VIRU|nr:hypothetical protein QJ849_gp916 [Powai lake megavirus]ANB51078.1 hypothetical protein [Powai lake megavirus]
MSIDSHDPKLENLVDKFELETKLNSISGSLNNKDFTNLVDYLLENPEKDGTKENNTTNKENNNLESEHTIDSRPITENQNDDIESKYMAEYSKKQLEEKYIEEDLCLRDAYKYLTSVEKEIFMSMKSDKKNRVNYYHSIDEIMEEKMFTYHDYFLTPMFNSNITLIDRLVPITKLTFGGKITIDNESTSDNESVLDDDFYSSMNEVD